MVSRQRVTVVCSYVAYKLVRRQAFDRGPDHTKGRKKNFSAQIFALLSFKQYNWLL